MFDPQIKSVGYVRGIGNSRAKYLLIVRRYWIDVVGGRFKKCSRRVATDCSLSVGYFIFSEPLVPPARQARTAESGQRQGCRGLGDGLDCLARRHADRIVPGGCLASRFGVKYYAGDLE
jgi:hypothetical protein